MITGVMRCSCGLKFVAETTLSKTNGLCPKCGRVYDDSLAAPVYKEVKINANKFV